MDKTIKMTDYHFKNITFHKRPIPVQPEYRPVYRIAQIAVTLKIACKKSKASLLLLHLFSWALKSKENENELFSYIENPTQTSIEVLTFEPALNRALHFAKAEDLIEIVTGQGHYSLTEKGHKFADLLINDNNVLVQEKRFLDKAKKSITETLAQGISQKWSQDNVEN